jgi:hypothetical protein
MHVQYHNILSRDIKAVKQKSIDGTTTCVEAMSRCMQDITKYRAATSKQADISESTPQKPAAKF